MRARRSDRGYRRGSGAVGGLVLAALAVVPLAVFSLAAPAGAATTDRSRPSAGRTFTVGVRVWSIDGYDPDRPPRAGDRIHAELDLLQDDVPHGSGVLDCVVTDPGPHHRWSEAKGTCDSTFRLPDGDLRMEGPVKGDDLENGPSLPVVGGTRAYDGAHGRTVVRKDPGEHWDQHPRFLATVTLDG